MNEISTIVEQLQGTDEAERRLSSALLENPDDAILKINIDSIQKRHNDLVRRLDFELKRSQAELVKYHIRREGFISYPTSAVAKTLLAFQELVTAVFDALRSKTPKQRYRPAPENVQLSTFEFAGAAAGSVIVSLAAPNERLLAEQSEFDKTLQYVERILSSRTNDDLGLLAREVGIAAITKAYVWASTSVDYALDTNIAWGKRFADLHELDIKYSEAEVVKDLIELRSDETTEPVELDGYLRGFDGATSYCHLVTTERTDIIGSLSPDLPTSWTTDNWYHAHLMRRVQLKYSTGQEIVSWTLLSLTPIKPPQIEITA